MEKGVGKQRNWERVQLKISPGKMLDHHQKICEPLFVICNSHKLSHGQIVSYIQRQLTDTHRNELALLHPPAQEISIAVEQRQTKQRNPNKTHIS